MGPNCVSELRGMIYSQYPSMVEFARVVGWSSEKLKRVVNKGQEVTLKDASDLSLALGISMERMCNIFLQKRSTNVDNKEAST